MVSQPSTAAARNKLVIRRLPPTLPEDIFWNSVAPWIMEKTCLWKRYVKGKSGDGTYDAHPVHSRAYVLMSTPEAIADFHRAFDGHVYRSKAGVEYQAVVEFAPVQKTPHKAKVKVDSRQGTIDEDPDFLSYIESLNAPATKPILEVSVPAPQPTTTPLLEHLRTHAKAGTKGKGKGAAKSAASSSSATESARRAAALASVTAAATKRAAQAHSGPVMVAGKGREVVIASNAVQTPASEGEGDGQSQGQGKKGRKNKKKGGKGEGDDKDPAKDKEKEKESGGKPVNRGGGKSQGQRETQNQAGAGTVPGPAGPTTRPSGSGRDTPIAPRSSTGGTEQKEKGGGGKGQGQGPGRGGARGKAAVGAAAEVTSVAGSNTTAPPGEGAGRGGGGRNRGKDRSGRGQVMEILSRNSAGSGGKGGKGSTPVVGGVVSDPGAAKARIDAP